MALQQGRAYTATRFVLELNGQRAASLSAVEGGEAYAEVELEAPPVDGRTKKHLGAVRYEPVTIIFGGGVEQRLFEWLADTLAGEQPARDGAIVFVDYQGKESSRLEFEQARISEIELPLLDASSKQRAEWTVTFQPESTVHSSAGGNTSYTGGLQGKGGKQKAWLASNFRFRLTGLEDPCKKVQKVDSLVVRQPEALGSPPEIGNLSITVASAFVQPFTAWHEDFVIDGNNGDEMERAGELVLLGPDLKDELCTINFANVGIVRVRQERLESSSEVIARSVVELYVESVELADAVLAVPEPPESADDDSSSDFSRLADTLRELLPVRDRSEPVAERLAATAAGSVAAGDSTLRSDGIAAGERWARERASLPELEALAALDVGGWTDLRLGDGHSLADDLRAAGTLSADPGAVDLGRDDFVEGLVAGAVDVYREVLPVVLERQNSGAPSTIPSPGDTGEQVAALDLQMILQEQQQLLQILTNVSKTLHDTAQGVIRNLR